MNNLLLLLFGWFGSTYDIHEDFIGVVHVLSTTSAILTVSIKDILIWCILPLNNCRREAYDGASNMMGHLRGSNKNSRRTPSAIKVQPIVLICVYKVLQESVNQYEMLWMLQLNSRN